MAFKLMRLVAVGALLAAVAAVPAFGASDSQTSKLVQIGGRLVPPSQLSWFESHAGRPQSQTSKLVQIGGRLVRPSELSSAERRLSSAWLAANGSASGSTGSSSHVGRDLGLGIGAAALFAVVLVVAGTATLRRHGLTPA